METTEPQELRATRPGGKPGDQERPLVLMCCTHRYGSPIQVGSQHLARQFVRCGYRVAYLSAPITPLHLFRGSWAEKRARLALALKPARHLDGRLLEAVPSALLAPFGGYGLNNALVAHHWWRTALPPLRGLLRCMDAEQPEILYLDNIFLGVVSELVQARRTVFRVMDRHDGFPGWARLGVRLARQIAGRADLTVYSAAGLAPYVQQELRATKTACLPNGVDCLAFGEAGAGSNHLAGIPSPIILYAGMLDKRLDIPLIRRLAQELPTFSFVFVGPREEGVRLGAPLPNLYELGPVPHAELPTLLVSADAVLIPFDIVGQGDRLGGVRPLKLLEAMAAGKTVVCARWPEVEAMQSPALLYDTPEECRAQLERAVVAPMAEEEGKVYAEANDWSEVFARLLQALEELESK